MGLHNSQICDEAKQAIDFIDHIDHWLEYLTELLVNVDWATKTKLERQIRCLLGFRAGTNCNINHNRILHYYYNNNAVDGDKLFDLIDDQSNIHVNQKTNKQALNAQEKIDEFIAEFRARECSSMSICATQPIQKSYEPNDAAFKLIQKALASEDLFFIQGPPGTGKTTAIVEIILQLIKAKPNARILISSETHVAVDNAIDRLSNEIGQELIKSILRYPKFSITEFESEKAQEADALTRADTLWHQAYSIAPELTMELWNELNASKTKNDDDVVSIARWQARNLAEMHQVIGVTCNQIDHLMDSESQTFDLAIVDECSKATMPEWLMAMSVAKKCILVGDHKQLPPTFCTEESEVLEKMDAQKECLIRNGVIDRLFDNLPTNMKGTLGKQFRMLPHIGQFISEHFYKGELDHYRKETNHEFQDFGWLTYKSQGYRVPAQRGNEKKILINEFEIDIILKKLTEMSNRLKNNSVKRKISVALITPYRAQCKALRQALKKYDYGELLAVEVDTVDAFQGRQADVVFFSFVRNIGPATFYADDRRINVAISRARDAVYLVGDIKYISSKRLPVLDALIKLPILNTDS
ncbi:DEAD/DEAH box helicase [Acinetobacter venetianus]|uniref:DEAD/DEAH box helicase n=1 Tax=Acinetobacter venetianus TaxID=52133 RepID=UPI00214F6EFB|nr:AAA domain-containing protein [Acinetobacter venetianus]MCR4531633.1 AAA domain-containing protein [Acinetobacter venetianus]